MEFADSLTERAARAIAPLDPDLSVKFKYETKHEINIKLYAKSGMPMLVVAAELKRCLGFTGN
jgi:hypothetical protein